MKWIVFSLVICTASAMASEKCPKENLSRVDLTVPTADSEFCQNATDNNYVCQFSSNFEVVVKDISKASGVEIQGAYKVAINNIDFRRNTLNITDICHIYIALEAKQSTLNVRNCSSGQIRGSLKQLHISRTHLDFIEIEKAHEIDIIDQSTIDILSANLYSAQSTFQNSFIQNIRFLRVKRDAIFVMRNMLVSKIEGMDVQSVRRTKFTNVTIENVVQPSLAFENLEITKSNISNGASRCPNLKTRTSLITETYLCKRLVYLQYLSEDGHYMCSDKELKRDKYFVISAVSISALAGIILIMLIFIIYTKFKSKKLRTEKIERNGIELKKTSFTRKFKHEEKTFEPAPKSNTDVESHYCDPKAFVSQISKSTAIENIVYSDPTEIQTQAISSGDPDVIYG